MITDKDKAAIEAHYADEKGLFEVPSKFKGDVALVRKYEDEIAALKAKIALLEAKINTTKKIIKHCQPVEPSYANEELVDALTAIRKSLQ